MNERVLTCVRCGQPVQPGQRNCGNCGAALNGVPLAWPQQQQSVPPTPSRSTAEPRLVVNFDDTTRREPAAWGAPGTQGPEYRPPVVSNVDFESGGVRPPSRTPLFALIGLSALMVALILAVVLRNGSDSSVVASPNSSVGDPLVEAADPSSSVSGTTETTETVGGTSTVAPSTTEAPPIVVPSSSPQADDRTEMYRVGMCLSSDSTLPAPCDTPGAWQVVRFVDGTKELECPAFGGSTSNGSGSFTGGDGVVEYAYCAVPAANAASDQVFADGSCLVVGDDGTGGRSITEVPCDTPGISFRVIVVSRTGCDGQPGLVDSLSNPRSGESLCLAAP